MKKNVLLFALLFAGLLVKAQGYVVIINDTIVSSSNGLYGVLGGGGSSTWGGISGTITNQTDLITEFAKYGLIASSNNWTGDNTFTTDLTTVNVINSGWLDALSSRTSNGYIQNLYINGNNPRTGSSPDVDYYRLSNSNGDLSFAFFENQSNGIEQIDQGYKLNSTGDPVNPQDLTDKEYVDQQTAAATGLANGDFGDFTVSSGTATIKSNVITSSNITDGGVNSLNILDNSIVANDIFGLSGATSSGAFVIADGSGGFGYQVGIPNNSIGSASISNGTILEEDLQFSNSPVSGYVVGWDGSNGFQWIAQTGGGGGGGSSLEIADQSIPAVTRSINVDASGVLDVNSGGNNVMKVQGTGRVQFPTITEIGNGLNGFGIEVTPDSQINLNYATSGASSLGLQIYDNTIRAFGYSVADIDAVGNTAIPTVEWVNQALLNDVLSANSVNESNLNVDNAPSDEYVLTYEADTGNFEWQQETGGGGGITDGDKGDITVSGSGSTWSIDSGAIDANEVAIQFTPESVPGDGTVNGLLSGMDQILANLTVDFSPIDLTVSRQINTSDINRNLVNQTADSLGLEIGVGFGNNGDVISFTQITSGGKITPIPGSGVTFLNFKETGTEIGSKVIARKLSTDTWYFDANEGVDFVYTPPAVSTQVTVPAGNIGAYSSSGGAPAEPAWPATVASGKLALMVVSFGGETGETINTPAGWTEISKVYEEGTNRQYAALFWKVTDGTEGGTTESVSSSGYIGSSENSAIIVFDDAETTGTPYYDFASASGLYSDNVPLSAMTSTEDNGLAIVFITADDALGNDSVPDTLPSGYTQILSGQTTTGSDQGLWIGTATVQNGDVISATNAVYSGHTEEFVTFQLIIKADQ